MQNWSNVVTQTNGDSYRLGDFVRFDDATTNRTVTLQGFLTPSGAIVDTANTYTFVGPGSLSGPTGLTNWGTGTLHIGTSNDYRGPTIISNGTLSVFGGKAIGDSSAVFLADVPAAFLIITNGETIGSIAGGGTTGGNVSIQSGIFAVGGNGDSTTYAGSLSGNGTLSKTGNGTMTLTGSNTLSGSLLIKSGAIVVDAGGSVITSHQSIGANDTDNGTLTLKDASTYAVLDDLSLGVLVGGVARLDVR